MSTVSIPFPFHRIPPCIWSAAQGTRNFWEFCSRCEALVHLMTVPLHGDQWEVP